MKKNVKKLLFIALAITAFSSCKKDSPTPTFNEGLYEDGYFVTNEGNFGAGNGSISFVSNNGTVENNIFEKVNNFLLGDVVQSMNIINNQAYIVVNNSSKIEVASIDSLKYVTTIDDLVSPRYISKVSENKAYVSDWGINGVQVIDLITNSVVSSITCGNGPEGMAVSGDNVYVCNSGGWGLDDKVTVINSLTDEVETELIVGDKPKSTVVDLNGDVWVLATGNTEYDAYWNIVGHSAGKLIKINGATAQIDKTFTFSDSTEHPTNLIINESRDILYFSNGAWNKSVFEFQINENELPTNPLINKNFYGMSCNDGYIYGTDAVDFNQEGWSYRYTSSGLIVDSVQVGVIPGGYCFN